MKRSIFILVTCFLLLASPHTPAELDTNANNLSDLWEQHYNSGDLFPNTFDPAADPDQDGWTNAQEAAAGTNPFDPNPPNGFLRPDITHIPAVFDEPDSNGDPVLLTPSAIRVSWTTLPGKKYTLLYSPDLEATSWLPVEDPFIGTGTITEYNFPLAAPTKTFWRVKIEDTDSDSDGLTDAEENQLGTDPLILDSDGDDIPDNLDLNPLSGVPAFADTDGDGISDGEDPYPYISHGAPPVITRITQVGGRVINLMKGEKAQFIFSARNPDGSPINASDMSLFVGQQIQGVFIVALGGDKFSATWTAETHPNYPTALLQSLVIRYKDSAKVTAWLDLGSCDVAEWEGLIAGASDKGLLEQYLPNPWLAKIASHLNGKRLSPVELAGSERISGGLRYRGPLALKLLNTAGTAQIGEATIPTGYRYPMIILSKNPTSGNVTINRVLDVSSPEIVPARGIGHLNNSSYEVMITIPNGSMITAPNELKFQGLPDREDDPNFFGQLAKVTSETGYFYDHSVSAPVFSQSSRNLHLGFLTNSTAPDTYAPVLSSFGMILDLESSLKSYAAGPPANPGLPEPRLSLDTPEPMLMGSEEWRKVTIKVGPDTKAVSSGIGLWLREGENGDADPQSGFTITRKATDGTYVSLVVPEDGKINILPDDEAGLYAQLTSPNGLNLFIKRAPSVGKVHALSIELLKKHSWNPNESFRLTTLSLLPVNLILDNNNIAYSPESESLGVSNYVTNAELPASSSFGTVNSDPENFRLQARVLDSTTNSIEMQLEVTRNGTVVSNTKYTLDKKEGNFLRGEFLRLVTDSEDDAVSGNQTILVKLGDQVKVSYEIKDTKLEQEIQVGRPSIENNNEADNPRNHDIRTVKLAFHVFKNAAGSPCVTFAQIDQIVNDANERLAQAGIIAEATKDFGSGDTGFDRPQSIQDGFDASDQTSLEIDFPNADEEACVNFKDGDANTIDIMVVESINGLRATTYNTSRNTTDETKYNNWMVLSSVVPGNFPNTLPHEVMHTLLNTFHRADPDTALFRGETSPNKNVSGTKRIGPYPDAASATITPLTGLTITGIGQADTTTLRANAETLP